MNKKRFKVEGFGEVGEANLAWFVPNAGEKRYQDLAPSESTCGYATACGSRDFVRIIRIDEPGIIAAEAETNTPDNELLSFEQKQINAVRMVAASIATKFQQSRGVYDVEQAVKAAIATFEILRGVSVTEITGEILKPGSFGRNE